MSKIDSLPQRDKHSTCCNCKFLAHIHGHPLVNGESISSHIGYVCTVFLSSNRIVTLCNQFGSCEHFDDIHEVVTSPVDICLQNTQQIEEI